MSVIARTKVEHFNEVAEVVSTAGATGGVYFDFAGADNRTVVLLANSNSSAATVTIVKGNGLAGVADLAVSVPGNKTVAMRLDSAAFKIVNPELDSDGEPTIVENKGSIKIKSPATVNVSVIELP